MVEYNRIDKARLQSIFTIKTLLECLEVYNENPSKDNIDKGLSKLVNGKRLKKNDYKQQIRSQQALKKYIDKLEYQLNNYREKEILNNDRIEDPYRYITDVIKY